MSDSPITLPIAQPSPDGKTCMNCGYALDGLAFESVCPECGTAVQLSLRPNRLVFASPHWLRRIHRGFLMLEISIAFLVVNSILGGIASKVGVIAAPPIVLLWLGMALTVLFSLIELWGWWLVTTQEPSREGAKAEPGSVRRWVRALAVCCAALRLFSSVASALWAAAISWIVIPSVVSSLAFAVLILVAAKFFESLAVRAPLAPLLKTIGLTRSLTWLILVEGVLHLGGVTLVQLGLTAATPLFTCIRIPFWFAWLAWAVNYARVIDGCRQMMSRVARRAEYLVDNPGPLPEPSPAVLADP